MAGSKGLIAYLQKLAGTVYRGHAEKFLPVLHGIGDNGKDIFTAQSAECLGTMHRNAG